MAEKRPLFLKVIELQNLVRKLGISVERRSFADTDNRLYVPTNEEPPTVCAIWEDSDIPNDNEVTMLKAISEIRLQFQKTQGKTSKSPNTLILLKRPYGLWQFRRRNWSPERGWSSEPKPLIELMSDI